jgi:hypothetical protein
MSVFTVLLYITDSAFMWQYEKQYQYNKLNKSAPSTGHCVLMYWPAGDGISRVDYGMFFLFILA